MKKTKQRISGVILLICLLWSSDGFIPKANAQLIGFGPVTSHCIMMIQVGGFQYPYIVAFSSNCAAGGDFCVDNSCPTGTTEVVLTPTGDD